jgi:hypothetical protein
MDDERNYYERNREARKEYQKAYYKEHRREILRQLELEQVLEPDKHAARLQYQKAYYLKHRERLNEARRQRYYRQRAALRNPESGSR